MDDSRKENLISQRQSVLLVRYWKIQFACLSLAFCVLFVIASLGVYGYVKVNNRLFALENDRRWEKYFKENKETAERPKRSPGPANVMAILKRLREVEKRLNQSWFTGIQKSAFVLRGLPGNPGRDGIDGTPGIPGTKGRDGRDGRDGAKGPKGEKGSPGPQGLQGSPGAQGLPGIPGEQGDPGTTGVSYIRWGRKSCPNTGAKLVYEGIAGGSYYTSRGGAADYVCLPLNPIYEKYKLGLQDGRARMYGAEYPSDEIFSNSLVHHDVPCVRCHVDTRAAQMMIPARNVCPTGWTLEYKGYLMAQTHDTSRSMYTCVDEKPEYVKGTQRDVNGALFYFVEGICGSLPCLPYVNGRELTCAVCTR